MTGAGRACSTLIVPVFCRGHQQVLAEVVVVVNVTMCDELGLTVSEIKTKTMHEPERRTGANELDTTTVSQMYANEESRLR